MSFWDGKGGGWCRLLLPRAGCTRGPASPTLLRALQGRSRRVVSVNEPLRQPATCSYPCSSALVQVLRPRVCQGALEASQGQLQARRSGPCRGAHGAAAGLSERQQRRRWRPRLHRATAGVVAQLAVIGTFERQIPCARTQGARGTRTQWGMQQAAALWVQADFSMRPRGARHTAEWSCSALVCFLEAFVVVNPLHGNHVA